ncbi:anthrone oxygenase family protein [Kitasatospora sp. NPDC094016]|uniref:anthrone oxygenase family protein n=1 Tax=unclassified Kitasatospora TaxID=2633591 RepID=UPI003328BE9F
MRSDQRSAPVSYAVPSAVGGVRPGSSPLGGTAGQSRAAGPVLAGATIAMGLMAGLFFAFDVSVMPGLAAGDDRTYVTAMQHINSSIENGMFGLVFVGAFAATGVAAWLQHKAGRRRAALWAAGATVLYVVALMVTMGVNIPLNNELAAAGDPSQIHDFAGVRAKFEGTWVAANMLRTLLCTAGLAALSRSLVLHGRFSRLGR